MNSKIAILSLGPVIKNAIEAADLLSQDDGIEVDIYDMIWMKPIDQNLIKEVSEKYSVLITLEDGVLAGGFGSAVNNYVKSLPNSPKIVNLGIPDQWVMHGSIPQLQALCGYDRDGIVRTVKEL